MAASSAPSAPPTTTHHGIRADASEVDSELERMVDELKAAHPERSF